MKIAEGLLLQKDLAEEVSRLRELGKEKGRNEWFPREETKDMKFMPVFDIEGNVKRVKDLTKLHRKLSKAISKANWQYDLNVDEVEFKDWI